MNFYQNIEPFLEYFFSIRKLENYFSFDIEIPKTWGVPKTISAEGQTVPFDSQKGENFRGLSILCEINEKEVDKRNRACQCVCCRDLQQKSAE